MKNELSQPSERYDPLDEQLCGAEEYVPDNGFTARVLTALPAKQNHAWRRFVVLTVAVLAGAALAVWQLPALLGIFHGALPRHWSAIQWPMVTAAAALLTALGSLVWAMFALVNEEE